MTDIERAVQFANPLSGEVLTLGSPSEALGDYLADLRELESVLREHKRVVQRELLSRMDHSVSWTIRAEGLKITGTSPAPVEEWDGFELRSELLKLVGDGLLAIEAVDAAVEIVRTYKTHKTGINALKKLGGPVSDTIESLKREVEKERYVSVSRS